MTMQVSSIVKISTYAFTLLFSGFTLAQSESTHTAQINNPSKMHEILVEPGVTKIVAARSPKFTEETNERHFPFYEQPKLRRSLNGSATRIQSSDRNKQLLCAARSF